MVAVATPPDTIFLNRIYETGRKVMEGFKESRGVAIFAKAFMGIPAQRIRIDCVSEANHNLIRLLDEPGNNCEA